MQTITLPYVAADDDQRTISTWLRLQGCVVRSAYAQANDETGAARSEKSLRDVVKKRYPDHPLGSWAIHCAAREGMRLRKQRPDSKMVFGGRKELERRQKGLITKEEWRERRHSRSIEIVGDRTRWGNRHLRLSEDGLTATVEFLGKSVTLHIPKMRGKRGILLAALAKLTAACEISVSFSLGAKSLSLTFDPMDLRKLEDGQTLETIKIAEQGKSRRGRPRKDATTHYAAHRVKPIAAAERPVHPEWRSPIPYMAKRAVGVDMNPQWVAYTVIEVDAKADARDAESVRILETRLVHVGVPINAAPEAMAAHMARCARLATSLARKWHAATIVHEDGLGKLRWSKKSRGSKAAQTINFWSRNALLGGLARRCDLSGIKLLPIWGGYSTTIGNILFDLPDACAAATEIARRGLASTRGEKDCLPAVPRTVHLRLWKHEDVPAATVKAVAQAERWDQIHRAIKAANIGYRRLHPPLQGAGPGILEHNDRGYAVHSVGSRKSGRLTIARPEILLKA